MKKLWFILLSLCLALALCSCGAIQDLIDNLPKEDEETEADDPEETGSELPGANQKLEALANSTGYECAMTVFSSDSEEPVELSFGVKGNTSWFITDDGGGIAVVEEDSSYHLFDLTDGSWEYQITMSKDGSPSGEGFGGMPLANYAAFLTMGESYKAGLSKTGSATVAGRKCTVYSVTHNYGTVSASVTACIDDELGFLMKYEVTGGDIAEGEYGSGSFEVTRFTASATVPQGIVVPEPGQQTNPGDMMHNVWGDDDLTAKLPNPDFGTDPTLIVSEGSAILLAQGVTEDDVTGYIRTLEGQLQIRGELSRDTEEGTTMITYTATYEGVSLNLQFVNGMFTVQLSPAEPEG